MTGLQRDDIIVQNDQMDHGSGESVGKERSRLTKSRLLMIEPLLAFFSFQQSDITNETLPMRHGSVS